MGRGERGGCVREGRDWGGGGGKGEWQRARRSEAGRRPDRSETWSGDGKDRRERERRLGGRKIMQNACLVFAEMY